MMREDVHLFENPLRDNYEARAVGVWVAAAAAGVGVNLISSMPPDPLIAMTGICGVMALARLPGAVRLANLQKNFKGREISFITMDDLIEKMRSNLGQLWLGDGFIWETRHIQRASEILKRDWAQIDSTQYAKTETGASGQNWIHGIEPKERPLYQNLKQTSLHTLIVGTTGSGKTTLFRQMMAQSILRGYPITFPKKGENPPENVKTSTLAIDPKGDDDWDRICRAAVKASDPERPYYYFNPAKAEISCRINPLSNFGRVTELASRLAALIPSTSGVDPFTAFGWQSINNICQALVMTYQSPTLVDIKSHLELGIGGIVQEALKIYITENLSDGREVIDEWEREFNNKDSDRAAKALVNIYKKRLRQGRAKPEIDALISMHEHDRSHAAKMIASLLPILNMLTAGDLADLLSPKYDDPDDPRPIIDMQKVIKSGGVLMIGLDCLSDGQVGQQIGSLFLSELVSVAGERYNFGGAKDDPPVSLFIDEASEIINKPTLQLLNKSRGSNFSCVLASQEISSFAARLGSKEEANMVLANVNNVIALRTLDPETQEWLSASLPMTKIKTVMKTQGTSVSSDDPFMYGANVGERLIEEESTLFPPALFGLLPNLEYVAKLSGGIVYKGRLPILLEEGV